MENPLAKALSLEVKAAAKELMSSWESWTRGISDTARDHPEVYGELRDRTVKPGDCASRPEKSAAKIPALSNWPEPIRLQEVVSV